MTTDWRSLAYDDATSQLKQQFGFDFISIGLAQEPGGALRWLYASGSSGLRHTRIALTPGHGVGGIVLKTGRPMRFTDIDKELGPRAYSSFPIVFAEDLRSFIALPLVSANHVSGVLLCAFRTSGIEHAETFAKCIAHMEDGLCGFDVITDGFLKLSERTEPIDDETIDGTETPLLSLIEAREDERRSISRELHDGLAQELLSVSVLVKQIGLIHDDEQTGSLVNLAEESINRLLEETRNLSVQLRPLALDDLGLAAALRAQASVYSKMFGARISVDDSTTGTRLSRTVETHMYRIAQEALLNACKYSHSDAIDVIITENDQCLTIAVCDQGTGFDPDNPKVKGHGCGMGSMRERAKLMNANLNFFSSSKGTTVTISVPLP